MLGYLGELYGDAWTVLRIGKDRSEPIKIVWGVRQGDHLSVISSMLPSTGLWTALIES